YDRDVKVGDRVYIRGVADVGGDCDEVELWTYITGFASDEVASITGSCREDTNNQATVAASTTIQKTGGANNCVTATANGTAYDGLEDGHVSEVYTIEVTKSGIAGCQAARLRVTSASGTDNESEVEPADFGSPTDIGSRGLTVTFDNTGGSSCSSMASAEDVAETQLVVGQKWVVSVTQAFNAACCAAGGAYAGDEDDVYVIEVTKGGTLANLPEIMVTTIKGLDYSGPTTISALDTAYPVGSNGVTISFRDCPITSESSGSSVSYAGADPAGLRTGDKFYITVTAASNGPIRTLILRHDVPEDIRDATDLDLRLFIEDDIEISEERLSSPPLVNWEQESTQITIKAGITAYNSTWTYNGVEQPLTVWSGTLFIHYREWLAALTDEVGSINDVADIDEIDGPLDADNPLKWAVYKALQNSNGTYVKYTSVADPEDADDWQVVLDLIAGRDDIYNLVPLTYDSTVLGLYQAFVNAQSDEEIGAWKAMFMNLRATTTKMVVGQSSASAQALHPTSTDGEVVLATLGDNPNASGTQYTLLSIPEGNGGFVTYGVEAGDIVRFLFTVDAFGTEDYTEFVVDSVLSEDSLLLLTGYTDPVTEPQRVEIWHTLSKNEIVTDLKGQAQAFADRRVCAIWPDLVGTGGESQYGYFLCAALAGLVSGVAPHQGLTNVEVAGWDDYSRSYQFFSDSQLDDLDDGGVWIVTEDRDGTPHTRHALTTDTIDINRREEMIRRNVDSMSYLFLGRLGQYIGRTNVTPSMLRRLEYDVTAAVDFLKINGFTTELGPQLIDGSIREGYPQVHPLLADRVQIILDLEVPAPMNNLELHLIV
ncbi:MAG: hypothetical protein ACYS7M_11215, partial [Planctomycetota bacterium]